MRNVKITATENAILLLVELFQDEVKMASFQFYNYIGYGDKLSSLCSEWVTYGAILQNQNGLVKID